MTSDARDSRLETWIGRTQVAVDIVTDRLVERFLATTSPRRAPAENPQSVPLGLHWCLAPPATPTTELGVDGHPKKGGFLPPVPLPRRMWAGGSLTFLAPLSIGDQVTRSSRIAGIEMKTGRSGSLCFVRIEHEISNARGPAIRERQDLVYREAMVAGGRSPPVEPLPEPTFSDRGLADPVTLFRYSALTFNAHRIHYDRPYAVEVENYPDLVVHGPLQATYLLHCAERALGQPPCHFEFRAISPVSTMPELPLCAAPVENGLQLWTLSDAATPGMIALARK